MSHFSNIGSTQLVLVDPDSDPDAVFLRALYRAWPEGKFDASSVSGNVHSRPELKLALRFLDPKYDRSGYLTRTATQRVRDWIDRVEGQDIAGLQLVRDRLGWADIVEVGGGR